MVQVSKVTVVSITYLRIFQENCMVIDVFFSLTLLRLSSNNNFAGGLIVHSEVDSFGNIAFLKSRWDS